MLRPGPLKHPAAEDDAELLLLLLLLLPPPRLLAPVSVIVSLRIAISSFVRVSANVTFSPFFFMTAQNP